jgi:enterochelin esterase-like enzyme
MRRRSRVPRVVPAGGKSNRSVSKLGQRLPIWSVRLLAVLATLAAVACARRSPDHAEPNPPLEPTVVPEPTVVSIDPIVLTAQLNLLPGDGGVAGSRSDPEQLVAWRELTWTFDNGPFGPTDVLVSVPMTDDPEARFPVLVAFHGRGESFKGSRQGARAWFDDYELGRAIARLAQPPLISQDFEDFVRPERLEQVNQALVERAYGGLIVVCPFLPDVLHGDEAFGATEPLARFVVDVLLPRVYADTPAIGTAESTGIDGVSLGGRASLLIGLNRPTAFGSVAGLQAAFDASEVDRVADLAVQARLQNPKLALRLLTSDDDYFLNVNQQLSAALSSRSVRHGLARIVGTHSYRFNRGPGGIEMLLFHDRVLRGFAPL